MNIIKEDINFFLRIYFFIAILSNDYRDYRDRFFYFFYFYSPYASYYATFRSNVNNENDERVKKKHHRGTIFSLEMLERWMRFETLRKQADSNGSHRGVFREINALANVTTPGPLSPPLLATIIVVSVHLVGFSLRLR